MEVVTSYKADITFPLDGVFETLKSNAGLLNNHTNFTKILSTLNPEPRISPKDVNARVFSIRDMSAVVMSCHLVDLEHVFVFV